MLRPPQSFRSREAIPGMIAGFLIVLLSTTAALAFSGVVILLLAPPKGPPRSLNEVPPDRGRST